MLLMQGITKRFGNVQALECADFSVKPGEIMALLGANGSGKSTLMKVLGGLVRVDAGQISLNGQEIKIQRANDVHKYGIAIGLQDSSLIPTLSVLDNILLGLEFRKNLIFTNREQGEVSVKSILERLKTTFSPDMLVSDLLPSDQAMVEIAKALARNPDILVLDEVTASLYSEQVDSVFEELLRQKEAGKAIVIVTHRMNEVFRICDSCTILRGGQTVKTGKVAAMDLDEIIFYMTGSRPITSEGVPLSSVDKADDKAIGALIETRGLSIESRLNNVHFQTYPGEIVGIGGLNGQGQSEFIRCLFGALQYSEGEIIYDGSISKFSEPADAVRRGIAFISGDRNRESIFPLRTVAENIYAAKASEGSYFKKLTQEQIHNTASEIMSKYKIVAASPDHQANSLSGGNQQKLVIGRWLGMSPRLLLLDDPTKGVDIHSRREIHQLLREVRAEGVGIIYVSSDNDELLEISDRIYIFYEGHVSAILQGNDRSAEKMVSAMLGVV